MDHLSTANFSDCIVYACYRYSKVRYNCMKSSELLLPAQSLMIQWSSDVNVKFNLSYIIGDHIIAVFKRSGMITVKAKGIWRGLIRC